MSRILSKHVLIETNTTKDDNNDRNMPSGNFLLAWEANFAMLEVFIQPSHSKWVYYMDD